MNPEVISVNTHKKIKISHSLALYNQRSFRKNQRTQVF